MALGIALIIISVLGFIYGIKNKNKPAAIVSVILFIIISAVGIYFYYHPY